MKSHGGLGEEGVTTYISADMEALYKTDFLSKQKQTPISSAGELRRQLGGQGETWLSMAPRMAEEHRTSAYIIRYYEEKILQLQQELARYKDIFRKLQAAGLEQEEGTYGQGASAASQDPLREKLLIFKEGQPDPRGLEI